MSPANANSTNPPKPRLAVLASGSGTNFQAIAEAVAAGQIDANLVLLFCDHHDAYAKTRAAAMNIPAVSAEVKEFPSKGEYETHLLGILREFQVDLVALAGYMRIVGPGLLAAFPQRIVNIHPALLPAFPGRHGIEDAFNAGVTVTGVTVHYVDEGIDTGPIIAQREVPVLPDDTVEDLEERIHAVEHQLYPAVLADLVDGIAKS